MCDDSKHDDNSKHDDSEVLKRRQFLKIGAASAAAAGLGVSSTTATAHHEASDPYAPPAKAGLPPSDMVLNLKRTALVVTDPQIDFLSPDGVTESPRVCRRLNFLRGLGNEDKQKISPG